MSTIGDLMRLRRVLADKLQRIAIAAFFCALCLTQGQASSESALTDDQRAISEKLGKPDRGSDVAFAGAPTDPIGSEVRLPFRDGHSITLVRKGSALRNDGSITWTGEVLETGERAILMLWGDALLT